jgi:hypothetical protein
MRLATFNVENMFERPAAMNLPTWEQGEAILQDFSNLNTLIAQPAYTAQIKADILAILGRHPGLITQGVTEFMRLREVRGKLLRLPAGQPPEVAVNGRGDWVGWFELVKNQVNAVAIMNTARIVSLVNADGRPAGRRNALRPRDAHRRQRRSRHRHRRARPRLVPNSVDRQPRRRHR